MPAPGEPSSLIADPLGLLTGYLDFFEDVTLRKISGFSEEQPRTSTVPSGWTPLGMIKHLACTERFWVRHIFLGEQVDFSWPGDPLAEWRIDDSDTTDRITTFYCGERAHARRGRAVKPGSGPSHGALTLRVPDRDLADGREGDAQAFDPKRAGSYGSQRPVRREDEQPPAVG
jgi:hypothetical protein